MAISTQQLVRMGGQGAVLGAGLVGLAIFGYNATRTPDHQTIQGISNSTLIAIAVAAVAFAWLTSDR